MYPLIIVDDEDITRMAVSGYIQKYHKEFQVSGTFSNGAEALKHLETHPVCVVITDIRMPRMDGLSLCKHISTNYPNCMIIIISGYNDFNYAKQAITYGVSNYLLKPLDFEELSLNLKQATEKLSTLYIVSNYQEEEIQLFFTDMLSGMLSNQVQIKKRFETLELNGDFDEYKGLLIAINPNKEEILTQWKYGREKLATALLNALRLLQKKYETYHLFRSGLRYYFCILSVAKLPRLSIEELESALYHLLHFTCKVHQVTSFQRLDAFVALPDLSIPSAEIKDDDIVIQKAMSYIQSHYQEDLTREDVADAVFLSSAYFSRFFKQKTGLSFIDYLTTVRMQKAAELLNTKMKVGEIAHKVGYQSRNRFFINFRQYSGYNPTEYRRQILRMEDIQDDN